MTKKQLLTSSDLSDFRPISFFGGDSKLLATGTSGLRFTVWERTIPPLRPSLQRPTIKGAKVGTCQSRRSDDCCSGRYDSISRGTLRRTSNLPSAEKFPSTPPRSDAGISEADGSDPPLRDPVRRPAPLPGTATRAPVHGQVLCGGLFLRFRAILPLCFDHADHCLPTFPIGGAVVRRQRRPWRNPRRGPWPEPELQAPLSISRPYRESPGQRFVCSIFIRRDLLQAPGSLPFSCRQAERT